ncbi:MAG TPA: hypothetical protein V6D12_18180 [Candidatus Obscuribacterales bacterium]
MIRVLRCRKLEAIAQTRILTDACSTLLQLLNEYEIVKVACQRIGN